MSKLDIVTDADFDQQVDRAEIPVLVFFTAPWCGPGKMCLPFLEGLKDDYNGKALIFQMDADENPDTVARFAIQSLPTAKIFKKTIHTLIGAQPKENFKAELDSVIN